MEPPGGTEPTHSQMGDVVTEKSISDHLTASVVSNGFSEVSKSHLDDKTFMMSKEPSAACNGLVGDENLTQIIPINKENDDSLINVTAGLNSPFPGSAPVFSASSSVCSNCPMSTSESGKKLVSLRDSQMDGGGPGYDSSSLEDGNMGKSTSTESLKYQLCNKFCDHLCFKRHVSIHSDIPV